MANPYPLIWVKYNFKYDFKVTGVLKQIPDNSFLKFDFIYSFASISSMGVANIDNWNTINYETHILLDENVNYRNFEKKLIAFVEKHHSYDSEQDKPWYYLQPLKSIHLHSNLNFEVSTNSNIKYIYLFSSIAILILVIACVNYVNLATARSTKRYKEIGIRKTIGAHRIQVIKQFLGESFIITFIALTISLFLSKFILPAFSSFVKRDIEFNIFADPNILIGLVGILIVVGIISGMYPAFLLSSFQPINSLKSNFLSGSGRKSVKLRNMLVLLQFCTTVILVIFTVVIQKQLHYIKFKDAGFDRENIVVVQTRHKDFQDKFKIIKDDLLKNPNILGASFSNYTPVGISNVSDAKIETNDNSDFIVIPQVNCAFVDYDFVDVNGLEIIAGRNFSLDFSTDNEKAVIINKTAARIAGIANPLGKKFTRSSWGTFNGQVIGVEPRSQ